MRRYLYQSSPISIVVSSISPSFPSCYQQNLVECGHRRWHWESPWSRRPWISACILVCGLPFLSIELCLGVCLHQFCMPTTWCPVLGELQAQCIWTVSETLPQSSSRIRFQNDRASRTLLPFRRLSCVSLYPKLCCSEPWDLRPYRWDPNLFPQLFPIRVWQSSF